MKASPRRVSPSHRQRGVAIIEFAMVFPLLVLLTFSLIDISRAFFVKNLLHQAAREGVRTLVVNPEPDSADVRVLQVMSAANAAPSVITHLRSNRQMGIRVETQFKWLYPGVYWLVGAKFTNPMKLSAEAWMRRELP